MEHYGVQFTYWSTYVLWGYCSVYVIPLILDYMPEWTSRRQVPARRSKWPLLCYHLMSMASCYVCVPYKNEESCILYVVAVLVTIVCVWLLDGVPVSHYVLKGCRLDTDSWAAETCSHALLICSAYYCELLLCLDINKYTPKLSLKMAVKSRNM
jgi:hypothetical protein